MSNKKTNWISVTEAFEQGKILNRWGNPASLDWYYKMIRKGKLKSKIEGNQTYIEC
jgi:hypothetical protein